MPEITSAADGLRHFHGGSFAVRRFPFQVIAAAAHADQLQQWCSKGQADAESQSCVPGAVAPDMLPPLFRCAIHPEIPSLNAGSLENDRPRIAANHFIL